MMTYDTKKFFTVNAHSHLLQSVGLSNRALQINAADEVISYLTVLVKTDYSGVVFNIVVSCGWKLSLL